MLAQKAWRMIRTLIFTYLVSGVLLTALAFAPVFRRSTRKVPSFSSRHFFISFPASRFFLYLQQIFNALLGLFLLKKFF